MGNNNNYYNYPSYYPQQYTSAMPQHPQQQPYAAPAQVMTPPTIHAEIVQVDGEDIAYNYPVAVGASQMMISKDETAIYIKSAYSNGQTTLDVYEKQKPKPQPQQTAQGVDMSAYVTRDELEGIINKIMEEKKDGAVRSARKQTATE